MIYLLDSSALSDFMRRHPKLDAKLSSLSPDDRVITSAIVRGEIMFGISRLPEGKRRDSIAMQAQFAFSVIPCEPLMASAADHYASIKARQQKAGLSLDENDLWIAAAAADLKATVVTRDADFQRLAGVAVQNWTA